MQKNKEYKIYYLSSKNKEDIFYIGSTSNSLKTRLKQHQRDAIAGNSFNKIKNSKILSIGNLIEIHQIASFSDKEKSLEVERMYIQEYIKNGHPLVNSNIGEKTSRAIKRTSYKIISATVKKSIKEAIIRLAKEHERSFSNMLDLLLSKAIVNYEKERDAKDNSD